VSQSASVWIVLLATLLAANLPFVNERVFGLIPLSLRAKPLAARFAELVVLYLLAIGLGLLFERRAGQIAPQGWEFYAVTGALFIVLAFPGFTWRYLLKHRK
jgi:Protein of unknown function (DUF2818)